MHSKILYTAGSIIALLVMLTIFFSIRPEGFLRRNEPPVTQAEVDAEIDREDAADATADAPDPTGDPDKKA